MEKKVENRSKAGMILLSYEEEAKVCLIADRVTLLESNVKICDNDAYIELDVVLASSNIVELKTKRDIRDVMIYFQAEKGLENDYSNSLAKSLIATVIVDRFYDSLLKTETVGHRRTISWWNFVSHTLDDFIRTLTSGQLDDHLEVQHV